jgi:GNAT superfamily N-acetyltransferase
LAALLVDAVESGASVSFMAPLTLESARIWWHDTLANAHPYGRCFVARDDGAIVGTVLLQPAWQPNQPHRADVAKLLVHRRARRRGWGRALMIALEREAADVGLTLLTLDTVRGDAAEPLYRHLGWTEVGVIPRYALYPDGTPCDTVIFYKILLSARNPLQDPR